MKKVRLFTNAGEYVITLEHVPNFNQQPDVIVWGSRSFLWNEAAQQYREGFAYYYVSTFIAEEI